MTLLDIQKRVAAIVSTLPVMAGQEVIVEDKGDLLQKVATALAKSFKLCAVVTTASGAESDSMEGVCSLEETLEIAFFLSAIANREIALLDVVDAAMRALHEAPLDVGGDAAVGDPVFRVASHLSAGDGHANTTAHTITLRVPNAFSCDGEEVERPIYTQTELDAAVAAALDAAGIPPPNLYGIWQRPMSRPAVPADAGTDNAYILLGIPSSGLNASFTSGIEDWGDGTSQPGSTHFYPAPAPEELGEEGFLWRWVLLTPGATFATAHPATAACVAEIYLTPAIGTVDLACLPLQNCNILSGVAVAGLVVSATNFVNLKRFSTTNKVACSAYADSVETSLTGNTSPMGSIPATTKFIKLNWDGATSGATLSIAHAKLNPNALDSFISDLPTVTTARNLTIGATQLYTAAQAAAALAKKWTFVGGTGLPG